MTKNRRRLAFILIPFALLTPGCGGGGASEEDVQRAVADALASTRAEAPEAPAAPPAPETPSPPAAEPAPPAPVDSPVATVDFAMPNFRGQTLQEAQDSVQELGIFFSISHDLLGNRSQVLDSNWQVCGQTPAPGARVKGPAEDFEGKFDFGAVKLSEQCP